MNRKYLLIAALCVTALVCQAVQATPRRAVVEECKALAALTASKNVGEYVYLCVLERTH